MKVAVLNGGRSHERAVSLRSGARVEHALRELGHEPDVIDVGRDTSRRLADDGFDVAFVALHGRGGEDGGIQALLELLGVAYTGSRPGPCEAAFDKARAKRLLRAAGVPTADFFTLTQTALEEYGAADALGQAREAIGFPLVVKPVHGGSALGVRFVDDDRELPRALIGAMSYDRHVLVERHVEGRELAVCVHGEGDAATALPAVHIRPRNAGWYDFESRYTAGETEFTCPPDEATGAELAEAERVALAAYRALSVSGFGRVDLILDAAGVPWVLELATVPGMTDTSLFPLACEAGGLPFPELVARLLDDACSRK